MLNETALTTDAVWKAWIAPALSRLREVEPPARLRARVAAMIAADQPAGRSGD